MSSKIPFVSSKMKENGFTSISFKEKQFSKDYMGIHSVQMSLNDNLIVAGYGSGCIQLHDAENGNSELIFKGTKAAGFPITAIRFFPTDPCSFLAASSEGIILICSTDVSTCKGSIIEQQNIIHGIDFNIDGSTFVTVGSDTIIRLYDSSSFQILNSYPTSNFEDDLNIDYLPHKRRIFSVKFHPSDPYIFITAAWDNFLKFWDSRMKQGIFNTVRGTHICSPDALDWQDKYILSASWVKSEALQIREFPKGDLIKTYKLPNADFGEFLYCARFGANGTILAGGSGTKRIQAIDSSTGDLFSEIKLDSVVQTLTVSSDGKKIVGGDNESRLIIGKFT